MAQMAFSGSFDHSLDGKGRVIIPASFREALGEDFTITINPNKTAVAIYPKAMWDQQLERLSHINPMDKVGIKYERYVMIVMILLVVSGVFDTPLSFLMTHVLQLFCSATGMSLDWLLVSRNASVILNLL